MGKLGSRELNYASDIDIMFLYSEEGTTAGNGVDPDSGLDCHMLGCVRLSVTTNSGPLNVDSFTPAQHQILSVKAEERTPDQNRQLFDVFRFAENEFTNLNQQIDRVWTNWPSPATTMVLHQREHPRVTHLLKRGDRLRPAGVVEPGVPEILPPMADDAPRNRLGFARWIANQPSKIAN